MAAQAVASRRTSRRTRGSRTTAEIANAMAKKPMKVWLVAPRPAMKKVSTNAAGARSRCQRAAAASPATRSMRVEGVDALDVGLAPEARREGEQERRHDRGDPIEAEPARQTRRGRRSRRPRKRRSSGSCGTRSIRSAPAASTACRAGRRADSRSGAGCRASPPPPPARRCRRRRWCARRRGRRA